HEHASLSLAQQCSGVPAGVPLFTSMLNYRYIAPEDASQAQAWEGMQVLSGQERTNFPVDLSVDDRGDEFVLVAQVITQIGASRILAYMQQALQALMLGTVTMREMGDYVVGVPESEQLIRLGRHPQAYEYREAVHVTIERQARHHPDALALVCQGQLMSYAHLDQRANQLAHLLIAQGVGVESAVGLAVERSADMIVAVLAVLKAGGVYVPLDPNYPQDRQTHIVHDSAMAYVLTDRHWNCAFALPAGVQVLNLDELPFTDQPAEAPVVPVHADNLAYLIYTSGSTGQPKGVAMTHRDLAVQSAVTRETFGLTDRDRVLQFSTINFDGFIEQVFPALSVGASLVVRGPDLWDSTTFYEQLLGEQITVVDLTTAYWTVLIHDFAQRGYRDYGRLRLMQVGGEALAPEALNSWRAAGLESVSLLNSYGPTEASVTATIFDCAPYVSQALPLPAQMQIGRALGTRQLYVLDAQLSVCPLGVAGELYIGGPLLARAYQNRAELTAERFVADPFSQQGARLYRTGDRVCWNEAGQLEYLGRLDHQVKVRGFRIELGEVESQLLSLEGVREAVVVARSGPQG
ncbi:non-ribosomal peptide synthetase, partial [Serratia marcescens]|uniref:non-ribosomal peptide synthetase n=1 Tax=Serratia marcescens TaxID=615 RepID=UPI0029330295